MSASIYTLRIEKALNGWIVKTGADTMVVTADEDLAGAIAASLIAGRLSDDWVCKDLLEKDMMFQQSMQEMQRHQNIRMQKYLDVAKMSPPPNIVIGTNTSDYASLTGVKTT